MTREKTRDPRKIPATRKRNPRPANETATRDPRQLDYLY